VEREKRKRTCFVLSALGETHSPNRVLAETVTKEIIAPVARSLDYELIRVDRLSGRDDISHQIANELLIADIVIADLTSLNPNVMYEIGIRHAWGLPLIPIALEGTPVPFDLSQVQVVFYGSPSTASSKTAAQRKIRASIKKLAAARARESTFAEALYSVARRYEWDSVLEALKDSLEDFLLYLLDLKHELTYLGEFAEPEMVGEIAMAFRRGFTRLSDKIHIFRQIVTERDEMDPVARRLSDLLSKVNKALLQAEQFDQHLYETRLTKSNLLEIGRYLESNVEFTQILLKEIFRLSTKMYKEGKVIHNPPMSKAGPR